MMIVKKKKVHDHQKERTVAPGTQISVASVFKGVLCSKKEATDLLFLLPISLVDGREWLIFVSGFLFSSRSDNRLRSQIQKWLPELEEYITILVKKFLSFARLQLLTLD